MTVTSSTPLASPPTAPGSLTHPAGPRAVLLYLDALRQWRDQLRSALSSLDRRAAVASTPDDFTADLTLAMSLSESIDRRTDELITTWDSGRVTDKELARIAELTWSRLPDPLGNPSAFTVTEAATLAAALEARLAARLDADTIAGSGAADRIEPLRETLARARTLSETLGRHGGEADQLSADLEAALAASEGPAALGATVDRIADTAELLERDLIKETSLRTGVERASANLAVRLAALNDAETRVRAASAECRAKIADPPRLGIPDVDVLGPPPAVPEGSQQPGSWTAAKAALDAYAARVDKVAAALAEAERRFTAPLTERTELRGLADAYRAKAAARGLAEDSGLDHLYGQLRAVLWQAPCDLAAAHRLVAEYGGAVQAAVGAVPVTEPPVTNPTGDAQ
jgi:hypothetical protein